MLAFTDSALARLFIAASAIAPEQREQWLRDLANRLDPPIPMIGTSVTNSRARSAAARRQARVRARRKNHQHVYKLVVSDRAIEGLLDMMLASGRLSEREALDHRRVEAELARLLEAQGARWSR